MPRTFTAKVASGLRGGAIEVHIDSIGGEQLVRLEVPGTAFLIAYAVYGSA